MTNIRLVTQIRAAALLVLSISLIFMMSHCPAEETSAQVPPVTTELAGDSLTASQIHAAASAVADTTLASQWGITPRLARQIRHAATAHSIPLSLAFSVVWAESRFHPTAVSWAGARGLTQVMPATAEAHCSIPPSYLFIPTVNLNCGFSYLAYMHSRLGDWRLALIAYHRGPTRLAQELRDGHPHGTSEAYASSILSRATL